MQDAEPPEICVVEGIFNTPTQPIPIGEELDILFAELVEELDLTEPNKTAMLSLPPQKKWQIYCSRKTPLDATDSTASTINVPPSPTHYVDRLRDMAHQLKKLTIEDSPRHEFNSKIESHTALLDALKTALRTSAHSFVLKFIESQGLPALLDVLDTIDINVANSPLHTSLIGCIKALMNNSVS